MTIPKLKRVRVSTEQEFWTWLAKNADCRQDVMIVTCDRTSKDKYVSGDQVRGALLEHGWTPGTSYTLVGNLVGHVAGHA